MRKDNWYTVIDSFQCDDGTEGGYLKIKPLIEDDTYGLFVVKYNDGKEDICFIIEHNIGEKELYINDENPYNLMTEDEVDLCYEIFDNVSHDILEYIVCELLLTDKELCIMAMRELTDRLV